MTHQHGGTHYGEGWGHWDFVAETGMDYYFGNATKYVCRWRNKNGIDDLKKGLTYVEKGIESHRKFGLLGCLSGPMVDRDLLLVKVTELRKIYGLSLLEHNILFKSCVWSSEGDLQDLLSIYRMAIEQAGAALPYPITGPSEAPASPSLPPRVAPPDRFFERLRRGLRRPREQENPFGYNSREENGE